MMRFGGARVMGAASPIGWDTRGTPSGHAGGPAGATLIPVMVTADHSASAPSAVPAAQLSATTFGWAAASAAALSAALGVAIAWRWSVSTLAHSVLIAFLYPAVGALILRRQPRNTVAWLLVAIGAINGLVALATPWAPVALDIAPGTLPGGRRLGQLMAWMGDGIWILSHGSLLTLVPLLFPDGRLPSKRWSPILAFDLVAVGVQFAAPLSLVPQIGLRRSSQEFYPDERLAGRLGELGYDLVRVAAVLSVIALLWRLSRVSREDRGPYVWFATGAVAAVVLLVPIEFAGDGLASELIRLASVVTLPVGAAVAILHRRAYGIDVVVNRTIVYGVLTVVLAATYLGCVALVEQLVRESSTFPAVVAAGVAAITLAPLRQQVQVVVNRAMYGRRDEPHIVAAAVGSRLEAVAGGVETLREVTAEIAAALRLPFVAIEVPTAGGLPDELAATGFRTVDRERLALVVQGEQVGELVVGVRRGQSRLSGRDLAALREVLPLVAAAVAQVRLSADLRRARGRLANVLEEERRRIRRDLHDGLGPSLATVVMGLEEARAVHAVDTERTERLLGHLKQQAKGAINEIRTLVYGLRPPALDELGLRAALVQLVEGTVGRTTIEVTFQAPDDLGELSAATEVAAYRIVQEALTNVVRHSGASRAAVWVRRDRDDLVIEVNDNGRGLPRPLMPGVGVSSMRERAEDIGGTVTLVAADGTSMRAVLPNTAQ